MNPTVRWHFPSRHLGREVEIFESLASTNSYALALADDPTRHGLAVLARSQTAGRGQYGRSWTAPADSSVLMSLLLFPPSRLRPPVILTAWAAVAVAEVIRELSGLDARIKWPNDVLVSGKKVCGILIEQRTTGLADPPLAAVVGVGLNVAQSEDDFRAAGLPDAASLTALSGRPLATSEVAQALIARLDADYDTLLAGDFETLENRWSDRLGLLDREVCAELASEVRCGRILKIAFSGVVLRDADELIELRPEVIRHLVVP